MQDKEEDNFITLVTGSTTPCTEKIQSIATKHQIDVQYILLGRAVWNGQEKNNKK